MMESLQANYKLDHIGYLTDDITKATKTFALLGYTASKIINDDNQKTKICFLTRGEDTAIELVEPYNNNRSMIRMMDRLNVTSPYHVCFEVDDINYSYEDLLSKGWLPLFRPVEAPAFDNRLICYFYSHEIGYIELLNKK